MTTTAQCNHRALCIGCGDAIMERDGNDMAQALRAVVGYTDVTVLVGRKATQSNMMAKVSSLLHQQETPSKRMGTIFLFCSCHAIYDPEGTLWLLSHDAPNRQSHGIGLSVAGLRTACLKSTANVVVVLDCCYSGALATDNLGKLSRKWRKGPGRLFLTSSGESDVTFYRHGSRNSALTAAILKSLSSDNDGTGGNTCYYARDLAERIKTYFSERPFWGRSVCAEFRGSDFMLYCSTITVSTTTMDDSSNNNDDDNEKEEPPPPHVRRVRRDHNTVRI